MLMKRLLDLVIRRVVRAPTIGVVATRKNIAHHVAIEAETEAGTAQDTGAAAGHPRPNGLTTETTRMDPSRTVPRNEIQAVSAPAIERKGTESAPAVTAQSHPQKTKTTTVATAARAVTVPSVGTTTYLPDRESSRSRTVRSSHPPTTKRSRRDRRNPRSTSIHWSVKRATGNGYGRSRRGTTAWTNKAIGKEFGRRWTTRMANTGVAVGRSTTGRAEGGPATSTRTTRTTRTERRGSKRKERRPGGNSELMRVR